LEWFSVDVYIQFFCGCTLNYELNRHYSESNNIEIARQTIGYIGIGMTVTEGRGEPGRGQEGHRIEFMHADQT
jgi:hypothetical protein